MDLAILGVMSLFVLVNSAAYWLIGSAYQLTQRGLV